MRFSLIQTETETIVMPNKEISFQRPQHIAIIMDGNGRWAEARGLPRTAGHKAGVESLRRTVSLCVELNIPILTVFAFSSENWARPRHEVQFLLDLIATVLQREVKRLDKENVRIRIIGDCSRFSSRLQELIHQAQATTAKNTGLQLIVAANYGGQWDITQAAQKIAAKVANEELALEDITESEVNNALCLSDLLPPDLLIRTSGEKRLSNFLLWQLAYSELYFTDVLWPDFSRKDFFEALSEYTMRQRRFGLTGKQSKIK